MSDQVTDPNTLPEGAPDDPLTGHDYDGIQEYDNPLPGWWRWIFIGTIIFSVFYALYWHLGGPGLSERQEYEAELAAFFAEPDSLGGSVRAKLRARSAQARRSSSSAKPSSST